MRRLIPKASAAPDVLRCPLNYKLPKRTSVYGLLTTIENDDGAALSIDSTNTPSTAGGSAHGLAIGIRHSF